MNRCSVSLIIREIKSKSQYELTLTGMTNIKKKQKRKKQNAKNVGGLELVYLFGKQLKCHSLYDEELVSYSEHQNLSPAVLLLVFTQKN